MFDDYVIPALFDQTVSKLKVLYYFIMTSYLQSPGLSLLRNETKTVIWNRVKFYCIENLPVLHKKNVFFLYICTNINKIKNYLFHFLNTMWWKEPAKYVLVKNHISRNIRLYLPNHHIQPQVPTIIYCLLLNLKKIILKK